MEDSSRKSSIFLEKPIENITTDDLKIYFDNIVNNCNICIKFIDVIVNQLLNIDPNQFNHSAILEHPFLLILRDLIIELLENKNIVVVNLIKLFTKIYSILNDENSSSFHILFYHQTLLNTLVNYRFTEEFANAIDQLLNKIINQLSTRYFSWGFLDSDEEGTYLNEVAPYLWSTAYTNTFTHLFARSTALDQSKLDNIEKFYLETCPIYVCYSRKNERYMEISREILERMFSVYVGILMKFTEKIKDCSSIIIKPITNLMGLLQCISCGHDLETKIMNINEDFIDILWIIIYTLSIEQKEHTHNLLIYSLVQMFFASFEKGLLAKIKEKDIVTTLLKLAINKKQKPIRFEACRLLSVVMNNDDIGTLLMSNTKLVKIFFMDINDNQLNPFYQIRLANNLFCLKNLAQNDQIKMELLDCRNLRLLISFLTRRKQDNNSIMVCQRVLEILLILISTEKGIVLLKQNLIFLHHLKNLLSSPSEPNVQKLGQDILQRLNAYEHFNNIEKEQVDHSHCHSDLERVNNYDIFFSCFSTDRDICYKIGKQLISDKFQVCFSFDRFRRSMIKNSTIVLLCISDSSIENIHYQHEVEYIIEQQHHIIPFIVAHSTQLIQWFQKTFPNRIYIDFTKLHFEYAYENLKMEISQQQSHTERDCRESTTTMPLQTINYTGASNSTTIHPVSINAFINAFNNNHAVLSEDDSIDTFVLLWLDPDIGKVDRTSFLFRRVDNFIQYYTNVEQCESAIKSVNTNKIVFVATAKVVEDLLPSITSLRCVDSIFLYCDSNEYSQYKRPYHSKVVDLFKNVNLLVSRMEYNIKQLSKHLNIRRQYHKNKSSKHVLYEFGDFLWLNIFIEGAGLFHRTTYKNDDRSSIQSFIRLARTYYHDNSSMQKIINEFNLTYSSDNALRWYTHSDFPYKLLNETLRTEDFALLTPFLFFIIDLKECLTREYRDSKERGRIILYRGLNISSEELEKLKQRKDNLISMNGFISTTSKKSVSKIFAGDTNDECGKAAVIFKIECDTNILDDNLIFADIAKYSRFPDEEEVLIDIGAVFLIRNIKQDPDGTWIINMTGSTEISSISKEYIEHYEFDPCAMENPNMEKLRFITLCQDRRCYEKAQEHLERLLSKPNAEEIAQVYITMTRVENVKINHEILIRDYYDYIRDRLSTVDVKQLARILNKIGFFLPANEQLHNQKNILKLLEIHKDSSYDSSEMKNFSTVLPYFGDYYRNFIVSRFDGFGFPISLNHHHDARLTLDKPDDLLTLSDSNISLQSHSIGRNTAAKEEYLTMANTMSKIFILMKHNFNDEEDQ